MQPSARHAGSSPRVWGTLMRNRCANMCMSRFIPTGVGNASITHQLHSVSTGSSPRVWGTPAHDQLMHAMNAVHPHGCGERARSDARQSMSAVHPHGCGERYVGRHCDSCVLRFIPTGVGNAQSIAYAMMHDDGSSPRVWGTPLTIMHEHASTPVHPHGCGERISVRLVGISHVPVHPHGCGER